MASNPGSAGPGAHWLRKVLRLLGTLLILAALARYIYLDLRGEMSAYRSVRMIVPCGPDDSERTVVPTSFGRFCIERMTRDEIKNHLKLDLPWEEHVQARARELVKPGDVVIDVGAHIGTHTLLYSKLVGPQGKVFAYEPQFKMYQELLVNLDLNKVQNVRAEMVALGDTETRVSMSFAKDISEGSPSVGEGGNRVELRRLDSYGFEKVSLMKVDVEGFELKVLQGARETLVRHRPALLIEIKGAGDPPGSDTRRNYEAVAGLLASLGYDLENIQGWDWIARPR